MADLKPIDPQITSLNLGFLITYLNATGWLQVSTRNSRVQLFQRGYDDQNNPITIVLPRNSEYADLYERIADVTNTVALLENRLPVDVAFDIANVNRDVMLWRLVDNENVGDSISVNLAAQMTHGLQQLLVFSASVENSPKPSIPKATKSGKEYAQQCRFGQTRRGSFIFEIESPVVPVGTDLSAGTPYNPANRRATERLVRGLTGVSEAGNK